MSGRLRLADACGPKKGWRKAALGALVSSNFRISGRNDGCSIRFRNLLDDDASFIEITFTKLKRRELEDKLDPFLAEDGSEGCIGPGIALPWPAVLKLIGGGFSDNPRKVSMTAEEQRAEAAAEQLGIPLGEIDKFPLSHEEVRKKGDEKMIAFYKNRLCDLAAASGKSGDALADQFRHVADAINSIDNPSAGPPILLDFYTENFADSGGVTSSEISRRMALDFAGALGADGIEQTVLDAILGAAPTLCLEAVWLKVRSLLDAEVIAATCETAHAALMAEIITQQQPAARKRMKYMPPNCAVCRKKIREDVDKLESEAVRLKNKALFIQKQLAHVKKVEERMWQRAVQDFLES